MKGNIVFFRFECGQKAGISDSNSMGVRIFFQCPVEKAATISQPETAGCKADAGNQQNFGHGDRFLFFRNGNIICPLDQGIARFPSDEL